MRIPRILSAALLTAYLAGAGIAGSNSSVSPAQSDPQAKNAPVATAPATAGASCETKTLTIESPVPKLGRPHVIRHTCDGKTLDTELEIAQTKIVKNSIPSADRFALTPMGKVYATPLAPGESVEIMTPSGAGIDSYMPSRWNTAEERVIGARDADGIIRVTYDEVAGMSGKRFEGVYDVTLRTGNKLCASYKFEIIAYPGECGTATGTPSGGQPGSASGSTLYQKNTQISGQSGQTGQETSGKRAGESDKHYQKRLQREEEHRKKDEERRLRREEKEKREEQRRQEARPATPYTEVQVITGAGKWQITGSSYVQTAQGLQEQQVTPYDFDIKKTGFQISRFNKNSHMFANAMFTNGNDQGIPSAFSYCTVPENVSAQSFAAGIDARTTFSDRFGLTIGGHVEFQQDKTHNWVQGETSSQSNNYYTVRGGLMQGTFDNNYSLFGLEYTLQPLTEKYQSSDGMLYSARSSTEKTPALFYEGRYFLDDNRSLSLDLGGRYGKASTAYTSDKQIIHDANFWNLRVGIAKLLSPHLGVSFQLGTAHNDETFKKNNQLDRKGASNANWGMIGFNWRSKN